MNRIQIEYFLAMAKYLSFREAARQIHVSQPAISKQIVALEQEMDITLFERGYRDVKLTGSGKLVRDYFERVVGEYKQLLDDIRQDYERLNAVIRIGSIPNITVRSLPKAIRNFSEAYPSQSFHIRHEMFAMLHRELEEGELDLLIGMYKDVRELPGIVWRTVDVSRPVLLYAAHHPLAERECTLADFADETFLTIDPTQTDVPARMIVEVCARYGFAPKHTLHFNSLESVLLSVESGLGVTILHESVDEEGMRGQLSRLPTDYTERVVAAWKRNTSNNAIEPFIAELLRHVDRYNDEEGE